MADFLANAGASIGQSVSSFGQNLQTAGQGNFGPLAGQMMGPDAKTLIDVATKAATPNDPTHDPYSPDQPVVYGQYGEMQKPEPNKFASLLSMATDPKAAQQPLNLLNQPMPAAAPSPMAVPPRQTANGPTPLARQAFGRFY